MPNKKKKRKPYNSSTGRNYSRDYRKFQKSKSSKLDRAKRNKDRAAAVKAGKAKKFDGKDVHHKNGIKSSKTSVICDEREQGGDDEADEQRPRVPSGPERQ